MAEKSLAEQAAAEAGRLYKIKDPCIVDRKTMATKGGGSVERFRIVSALDPNGPAHAIALDSGGKSVPLAELAAAPAAPATEKPGSGRPAAVPITISPDVNVLTLAPGEVFDETLVVTVPANPSPARADIYFLADTTGSMGGTLDAVKTGAGSMLSSLAAMGSDFAYGVGDYKDFMSGDPYCFKHLLAPTATAASVTAAFSSWSASGGNDTPEGAFFALHSLAEPPGGTIGWRAGAKRIIVWFGDAPSHDPICKAASGLGFDITEASVTARLQAENIAILAISTATPGLDDDPKGGLDYVGPCGPPGGLAGQASRLAAVTGGAIKTGIDPSSMVSTIVGMVKTAISKINNVKLVPSPEIAPFVTSITPAAGYGPLASDAAHRLEFKVRLTGIACKPEEQVIIGSFDVVADGAVVARKKARITVPPCDFTYSVKFVCGSQSKCDCDCAPVRPGRYATAISIQNPSSREVTVRKRFVPVVFAGAAVGREPRSALPKAEDKIVLRPHAATMDDCCRINELLFGAPLGNEAPLTVGVLELTSSAELSVTAVYTVGGLDDGGGAPSISVETVAGRRT